MIRWLQALFRQQEDWFSFQWHITDACDQRCRHCYLHAGQESLEIKATDWTQMQKVVKACEQFCKSIAARPLFFLTGGDPLLHPDFWRLATLLHRRGHPFVILGNPFHLTLPVCQRLKKLGCIRYQLSLDGTEKTHDWMRKPGSYQATMAAIPLLKEAGIPTVVMTTVSSANLHEMPQIVDAVVKAQADLFSFARYCPSGGDTTNGLTPQAYRDLLYACSDQFRALRSSGCHTGFEKKDHLWSLYDYESGRFNPETDLYKDAVYSGCSCGSSHLTILPDGDVYACRRVPQSKVGNLHETPLQTIWLDGMEPYRHPERFEKCCRCPLLDCCRGCPAVAKASGGSFYSADPQCWMEG